MDRIVPRCLIGLLWLTTVLMLPGCATVKKRDRSFGVEEGALKVGEAAPDFKLKRLGSQVGEVQLASFRGRKPVILFFGSYT